VRIYNTWQFFCGSVYQFCFGDLGMYSTDFEHTNIMQVSKSKSGSSRAANQLNLRSSFSRHFNTLMVPGNNETLPCSSALTRADLNLFFSLHIRRCSPRSYSHCVLWSWTRNLQCQYFQICLATFRCLPFFLWAVGACYIACARFPSWSWYCLEQIGLQAKLLNYFLGSNKSNINQSGLGGRVGLKRERDTRGTPVEKEASWKTKGETRKKGSKKTGKFSASKYSRHRKL